MGRGNKNQSRNQWKNMWKESINKKLFLWNDKKDKPLAKLNIKREDHIYKIIKWNTKKFKNFRGYTWKSYSPLNLLKWCKNF